jgi:hypothetical protein
MPAANQKVKSWVPSSPFHSREVCGLHAGGATPPARERGPSVAIKAPITALNRSASGFLVRAPALTNRILIFRERHSGRVSRFARR